MDQTTLKPYEKVIGNERVGCTVTIYFVSYSAGKQDLHEISKHNTPESASCVDVQASSSYSTCLARLFGCSLIISIRQNCLQGSSNMPVSRPGPLLEAEQCSLPK